jgi:hypothetical protein
VTVTGAIATANITDDESATAAVSVTQQGAESGAPTSIIYTVTLSKTNNTGSAITFDAAHSGGTATVGSDFTDTFGAAVISVANGATTGTLTVPVLDDALLEGTETVQATISNSSFAAVTITGASATANITDDESANAVLSVTQQGDEAGPVNIIYTVTLSRTNNTGSAITFDLTDAGTGSATSGTDYTAFGGAGSVSIADGASTGTLTVTVLDDVDLEGTETVNAALANPSFGAVTVTGATATANIADDEIANPSPSSINESALDGAVVNVALSAGTFTGTETASDLGINNAPAGLTILSVAPVDGTHADVTLAFGGPALAGNQSITLQILGSALSSGSAGKTTPITLVAGATAASFADSRLRQK